MYMIVSLECKFKTNKLKILKKCFSIMDSSNFNIHYLPKIWKIVNMKH